MNIRMDETVEELDAARSLASATQTQLTAAQARIQVLEGTVDAARQQRPKSARPLPSGRRSWGRSVLV